MIHSDVYVNVPHFGGKFGVERMIEAMGFEATILRPAYFMSNEMTVKDVVLQHGVYPIPIGARGLAMVDARDLGEVAALELIRRSGPTGRFPWTGSTSSGRDADGEGVAAIWSEVLGRPVAYGGDDTAGFERNLRQFMPGWMAYDMRLMAERFLTDGMVPEAGDVERLTSLLGRPLRTYRALAAEIATA